MKIFIILAALSGIGYAVYMAIQAAERESKEARTVGSLPPSIQHVVTGMDGNSQSVFFKEFERKRKKVSIGDIAWIFIGWHYLYAGKVAVQFAFWFTLGGLGVWWLVDLFRVPSIIRSANEQMARECLQTLSVAQSFKPAPPVS